MDYNALLRRKLLEDIYDGLSDDDKKLFVQMTLQDKRYSDIMQALSEQKGVLSDIERKQSWWYDLSANVAGNVFTDGAIWLVSKLFKKL